jgi:uncharacterized repeat protein (TIGR01451 family)
LTIVKTADVSKAPVEGNIVYTLAVTNTSVDTACTNVVITDHIVDDLDCTSTTEPAGFIQAGCSGVAGDPVTWTAAAGLAFNTTATLTMSVKLGSGATNGETISNTATGVAAGDIVATPGTDTVDVVDCDLAISKSDDPSSVAPDGQITYTIKVENVGTVDCTEDITVTDGIPTDTDCVSIDVTDDNGLDINFDEDDCDASGDVVWDTDDTLADGDEVELQMVVELTSGAEDGDTIENVVCVQATGFAEVCDTESTKVDEDVVTKTPTPGPTATAAPPTATVRPVVPPVVAPPPPAPSAGLAPTLVAPLTGTGTAAGGSLPLALALGLAGGCLLLLGGVAMLRRPR